MNTLRAAIEIAGKDLRIARRTRQHLAVASILGLLIVVVLAFGIGPDNVVTGARAASILWVSYLLGGLLCFEKSMAFELADDALSALVLAPIDRSAVFLGKLAANLALFCALAAVVTPAAIILFRFDLSAAPQAFVEIMTLSIFGFACVGTLLSATVAGTRAQGGGGGGVGGGGGGGGLLAVLVLPLMLPLILTSTQMLVRVFGPEGHAAVNLGTLAAFDVVYFVASWLTFELVLEG